MTLLFIAVSAADRKILEEEVFVMEKCAVDYGIGEDDWSGALSESLMEGRQGDIHLLHFNEGDAAISNAIFELSRILTKEQKRELIEDLLSIALADDILHKKEKLILKMVCRGFDVHLKVPKEFHINSIET